MLKKIAEWSAQGAFQAVSGLLITVAGSVIWKYINIEALVGITCLVALFFIAYFGMKLFHLPKFRTLSEDKYHALKTLGKVDDGTYYFTTKD